MGRVSHSKGESSQPAQVLRPEYILYVSIVARPQVREMNASLFGDASVSSGGHGVQMGSDQH